MEGGHGVISCFSQQSQRVCNDVSVAMTYGASFMPGMTLGALYTLAYEKNPWPHCRDETPLQMGKTEVQNGAATFSGCAGIQIQVPLILGLML